MADMKTAVKAAITFVEEFFPGAKDIRLEEVGPSPNFSVWRVGISFKTGESGTLSEVMRPDSRIFKKVDVDYDNAVPVALRSWEE